jgi:hypothetical protein
VTLRLGDLTEPIEVRPRPLGIDMVGGHWRNAAPIVNAGIDQGTEIVGQVRRRLQVHIGRQDQPGCCERPQVVVARARPHALHCGTQLREEVLHNHFLHVAVAAMAVGNCFEAGKLIGARVTDPDEDAGGERNLQFARSLKSGKAARRHLVRRATVCFEVGVDRFDHHPLARAERSQLFKFGFGQRSAVGVREEAGFGEDQLRHLSDVVHGGVVTAFAKPVAGDFVAVFRPLPQRKQRFVTALPSALLGDLQDVFGVEIQLLYPRRWLRERAVPARIVAQESERDEDLRAVGDAGPERLVSAGRGECEQIG